MKSKWTKRLDAMSADEMFALHKAILRMLEGRLKAQKAEIERKLAALPRPSATAGKVKRSSR